MVYVICGWVGGSETPQICQVTLDYLNNMCQSAFDNSGSFKSKEGGLLGHPVSKNIIININLNVRSTLE